MWDKWISVRDSDKDQLSKSYSGQALVLESRGELDEAMALYKKKRRFAWNLATGMVLVAVTSTRTVCWRVTVRNVFFRVFYGFHAGRKAMSYKAAGIDVHKKVLMVIDCAVWCGRSCMRG